MKSPNNRMAQPVPKERGPVVHVGGCTNQGCGSTPPGGGNMLQLCATCAAKVEEAQAANPGRGITLSIGRFSGTLSQIQNLPRSRGGVDKS